MVQEPLESPSVLLSKVFWEPHHYTSVSSIPNSRSFKIEGTYFCTLNSEYGHEVRA